MFAIERFSMGQGAGRVIFFPISITITVSVSVIGRFVTNHICHRRYVTKRSDMYQHNYMDDLSQFFLVLGQFVTLLFWTICHKS